MGRGQVGSSGAVRFVGTEMGISAAAAAAEPLQPYQPKRTAPTIAYYSSRPVSPSRQWQTSSVESDIMPNTMVPSIRQVDTIPAYITGGKLPETTPAYSLPDEATKWNQRSIKSPFERLHTSGTHTVHRRDIERGLVLKPEPTIAKSFSSLDFAESSKKLKASPIRSLRPKTSPLPMTYAHESRVINPGESRQDVRIVSHCFKGLSNKKNPNMSNRNISRNPLGGYYTM